MFTYQVRPRIYRILNDAQFSFPNDVEIIFHFSPLQPFGMESSGGKTAVRSIAATAIFDANTGCHWIESKEPLNPLDVIIEEPNRVIKICGNNLHMQTHFKSLKEMNEAVECIFFTYPILLNIEIADPPFIKRVDGKVGDVNFRWELSGWKMNFETTTQDLQEKRIIMSWERINILSKSNNRRVIAALHYFHVACRLARAGNTPWEFMSEIIINLSKVLEVLFPPKSKDDGTIDAARNALSNLQYTNTEIERNFIPIIALRNNIDSAHVDLSIFTKKQLQILHAYTESAEGTFRELLKRLMSAIETKKYIPTPYGNPSRRKVAEKIIERIAKHCVITDNENKPQ